MTATRIGSTSPIAGKQALGYDQIVQILTLTPNGVVTPALFAIDVIIKRASGKTQPLNGYVAGFDLQSSGFFTVTRRWCGGNYGCNNRHALRIPSGVIGQ